MKKVIFSSVIVVALIVMMLPMVNPSAVLADVPQYDYWEEWIPEGDAVAECGQAGGCCADPTSAIKIEPWDEMSGNDGTYGPITIWNSDGYSFAWISTRLVTCVIIKAGQAGHIFSYCPDGAYGDGLDIRDYLPAGEPLHAISHVTFCFGAEIDALIFISPPEATNPVGDDHRLTALVLVDYGDGRGFVGYQGANVTFDVIQGVGAVTPTQNTTNTTGEATTTLTSNVTGTSIVQASTTIEIEGKEFYLVTDEGVCEYGGPAKKTWIDIGARISISPWEGTNVIGDDHVLTATVEVNDGTGWKGTENVTVQFTKTGVGTLNPAQNTTNTTGEATTTLTSNVTGTSTVQASANVTVKEVPFTLVTDGEAGEFNAPARKIWIEMGARISISPWEATNVIGDDHVLTAKVEVNDGTGWEGAENVTVQFTKTGVGTLNPAQNTTNTAGKATTTLTSNVTGTSTVQASANVTVKGVPFTLVTDGEVGEFNAPAKKTWVDARISISQEEDTNPVGAEHVLTAKVEVNDSSGWVDAENVIVYFTKTGVGTLNPAQNTTNTAGEATTILRSTEAGTSTVWASADVTVKGVPFNLVTDGEVGEFGGPVKKTWVDARISISPNGTNPVGTTHTFTVHVEKNDSSGWVNAGNVSVTGVIRSGPGSITSTNPDTTNANGEMTITITSSDPGTTIVDASGVVTVGDVPILVATNGYGAYDPIDNTKTWTDGNGGGYSCSCCYACGLTVDWEGCITSKPLYCSNDKLAVDLLGPSFDLSHNLFLERGTHAPVVYTTTHYVIVVRECEEIPDLPENKEAIVVFNITPANAEFNKDIFLTLGVAELPANALNVTMAYYDDVNGVWELMESEAGGPSGVAELTLSAPINHFSIYGVLAELEPTPPPQPARFAASGLNIVPSVEKLSVFVTKTGESVTITANVANNGGQGETYTVVLQLNGEEKGREIVTLGAGQSKQVSFTVSELEYGQYDVEVAGLSDEFSTSRTITWWLIIVIIAAVGLIIWGVVWGRRRRRKTQQEA